MVSNARLDLPEPESPVTTISLSRGISTEMFFRLCTRAPWTATVVRARVSEVWRLGVERFFGIPSTPLSLNDPAADQRLIQRPCRSICFFEPATVLIRYQGRRRPFPAR